MNPLVKVLLTLGFIVALAFLLVLLAAGFIEASLWIAQLLHLQHTLGMDTQTSHNYADASGSGPMMVAALGFSGAALSIWKHVNCEYPRCPRMGKPHPGHGRYVCPVHYHHDVVPKVPDSLEA